MYMIVTNEKWISYYTYNGGIYMKEQYKIIVFCDELSGEGFKMH